MYVHFSGGNAWHEYSFQGKKPKLVMKQSVTLSSCFRPPLRPDVEPFPRKQTRRENKERAKGRNFFGNLSHPNRTTEFCFPGELF